MEESSRTSRGRPDNRMEIITRFESGSDGPLSKGVIRVVR